MKVLIVEDDMISRQLMKKILSVHGECDLAVNGIEAIDTFLTAIKDKKTYDLVTLDIMMPKLDGIKVLKTLREIEMQYGIQTENRAKIIMTTALNDQKTVMDAYELGCEAYAWKPIDIEKFTQVLREMKLI